MLKPRFSFPSTSLSPVIALAVLLIVFLAYLPALKNNFVNWDDPVHLLENTAVRSLDSDHLKKMFTQTVNRIYIPLTTLSFAIEYHFYNYRPFVYHLDNLLLHLGAVFLVYLFGRRMGLGAGGAGVAALLFGLHPMRVESVAWITERKDVLFAFFYAAALFCYAGYLKDRSRISYLLTIVLGLLSMLAKPMAVSLPLILWVCDWFYNRKFSRQILLEKIPFVFYIVPLALITYTPHTRFTMPAGSLLDAVLIWSWSFVFYIRQFLLPLNLLPIYRLPQPISLANPEYLLSLIIFALIVIALVRFRRKRWFVFAFAFYFFSIFFLISAVDITKAFSTQNVTDRYLYLPGLGFCLWLGFAGEVWANNLRKKGVLVNVAAGVALLAVLGFLVAKTIEQSRIWKDSITLWEYQLKYTPDQPIALNNLATALRNEEQYKDAEEKYRTLVQLQKEGVPLETLDKSAQVAVSKVRQVESLYQKAFAKESYKDAYYNLAQLYRDIERFSEAEIHYRKAIEIDPNYKDAYLNLGRLYVRTGESEKAIAAFDTTIALDPANEEVYLNVVKAYTAALEKDNSNALYRTGRDKAFTGYLNLVKRQGESPVFYFNLGALYYEMGDLNQAASAYRRSLDIDPNYVPALYNLANLYSQIGQAQLAIGLYERVILNNPRFEDAYLNLGVVYDALGELDKSVQYYRKAISVNPSNVNAYFNLGLAYQARKQFKEATGVFEKVVALDPRHAKGIYNLANLYAAEGEFLKAEELYKRTIELDPANAEAYFSLSLLAVKDKDFEAAIRYCDEARLQGYDVPPQYLAQLEKYQAQPAAPEGK